MANWAAEHFGIIKPNLRKLFLPDPGYVMIDVDLDRADAQVVAWESNCENLKRSFREELDIHTQNAALLFSVDPADVIYSQRQFAKIFCHATNYGATARTVAGHLGISTREAEKAQAAWFDANPEIADWHRAIEIEVQTTRTVTNILGYRWHIFDRINRKLINEALAWKPQSTVGLVINRGWDNLERNLPEVDVKLQVHDSLVMQVPRKHYPELLPEIRKNMLIELPYEEPLIIGVGCEAAIGDDPSWGGVKPVDWSTGLPVAA